jgi:nicotinamidase-related amidase
MKKVLILLIISCLSNLLCYSQNKGLIRDKFLIVLDIQEYYTSNKLSDSSAQELISSVNQVISAYNPDNVIYVKSVHKLLNLSHSRPFIYTSVDTTAMCFDKRMKIVNEQTFTKVKSSAFSIKELTDFLKQNKANGIVIVGLLAEECVYESLLNGKELGYDMYMIPEAIVGKSQESKDKTIRKLVKNGIKILDINTLQK